MDISAGPGPAPPNHGCYRLAGFSGPPGPPAAPLHFTSRIALSFRPCCYSPLAGPAPRPALLLTPAPAGSARPGWHIPPAHGPARPRLSLGPGPHTPHEHARALDAARARQALAFAHRLRSAAHPLIAPALSLRPVVTRPGPHPLHAHALLAHHIAAIIGYEWL
jgi:hypothetical protein